VKLYARKNHALMPPNSYSDGNRNECLCFFFCVGKSYYRAAAFLLAVRCGWRGPVIGFKFLTRDERPIFLSNDHGKIIGVGHGIQGYLRWLLSALNGHGVTDITVEQKWRYVYCRKAPHTGRPRGIQKEWLKKQGRTVLRSRFSFASEQAPRAGTSEVSRDLRPQGLFVK